MAQFSISKDHVGVLHLSRNARPALELQEQETLELSCALYGFLIKRNESLDAQEFVARIRSVYAGDARQAEIERVVLFCGQTETGRVDQGLRAPEAACQSE